MSTAVCHTSCSFQLHQTTAAPLASEETWIICDRNGTGKIQTIDLGKLRRVPPIPVTETAIFKRLRQADVIASAFWKGMEYNTTVTEMEDGTRRGGHRTHLAVQDGNVERPPHPERQLFRHL